MSYIYIVLIVFAVSSIMIGIYVSFIQNKYVDVKYDNVLNFSNTLKLENTLKKVESTSLKVDRNDTEVLSSDFKKPVIIKSIMVEECLELKDEEIL